MLEDLQEILPRAPDGQISVVAAEYQRICVHAVLGYLVVMILHNRLTILIVSVEVGIGEAVGHPSPFI